MTTLAAWMVYALVVSVLFALAAVVAESALRAVGRSGRWVWLTAMALSCAIPVAVWLRPAAWETGVTPVPAAGFIPLAPVGTAASAGPGMLSVDAIVAGVWVLLTAAMSFWITLALARLLHSRRGWRKTVVWGESVWVTADVGPAVFGLGRGEIVMPAWALELDRTVQRLMLMHEREHLRAGDVRLSAFGLLMLLVFPWNLALWWQFRRLREAVEVDCDRRVLALDPDAHAYGSLLIEVGRHRALPQLALAFAEPSSFLERRIRMITAQAARHGKRAVVLGVAALVVAAVAVCTRDPLAPGAPRFAVDAEPPPVVIETPHSDLMREPVFTPFTRAPRLVNAQEVSAVLGRQYPPLLRDAGIGGEVIMWFFIDERGLVQRTQVYRSSGYPALDEAASRVADVMRYSPAYNRDAPTPVWVQIPIRFAPAQEPASPGGRETVADRSTDRVAPTVTGARDDPVAIIDERGEARDSVTDMLRAALTRSLREPARAGSSPVEPQSLQEGRRRGSSTPSTLDEGRMATPRGADDGPVFTPFTRAPRLLDAAAVSRTLEQVYPPLLRDAGIGGQVSLWFKIDATGRVEEFRIASSSGYPALDAAAMEVAKTMRYEPAENDGERVAVWVQIPVKFAIK